MPGKVKRGRLAGSRITVQPLNVITGLVDRLALTGPILTFQDVADALTHRSGTKVTRAMVWRFARGIEPHDNQLRSALGLPARVEVACCPRCGKPPLARHHRCAGEEPKPRKPRRNWRGLALVLAGVMINRIVDMTRKASYNEIV